MASLNESNQVPERLREVLAKVRAAATRAGRSAEEVAITAVTKTVSPARIRDYVNSAQALGIASVIGESYLSEFSRKVEFLGGEEEEALEKRYIGILTASQLPRVWRLFDVIETIGDLKTIEACAVQLIKSREARIPRLLIQVNISEDPAKAGFFPSAVPEALRCAKERGVPIAGFMTITERYDSGECEGGDAHEGVRGDYRALAQLAGQMRESEEFSTAPFQTGVTELSMGMSNDFEVAIEEGATHVRLGSVLFGERPER